MEKVGKYFADWILDFSETSNIAQHVPCIDLKNLWRRCCFEFGQIDFFDSAVAPLNWKGIITWNVADIAREHIKKLFVIAELRETFQEKLRVQAP